MPTKEQRISSKRAKIRSLDERIGVLMAQRADVEEELADLLPKSLIGNPEVTGAQPFQGSQIVVLEKRTSEGKIDFSEPQPPVEAMTFDALYALYFRESTGPGIWYALREWLESKGWVVRAKTW